MCACKIPGISIMFFGYISLCIKVFKKMFFCIQMGRPLNPSQLAGTYWNFAMSKTLSNTNRVMKVSSQYVKSSNCTTIEHMSECDMCACKIPRISIMFFGYISLCIKVFKKSFFCIQMGRPVNRSQLAGTYWNFAMSKTLSNTNRVMKVSSQYVKSSNCTTIEHMSECDMCACKIPRISIMFFGYISLCIKVFKKSFFCIQMGRPVNRSQLAGTYWNFAMSKTLSNTNRVMKVSSQYVKSSNCTTIEHMSECDMCACKIPRISIMFFGYISLCKVFKKSFFCIQMGRPLNRSQLAGWHLLEPCHVQNLKPP